MRRHFIIWCGLAASLCLGSEALAEPVIRAYLYNPTADAIVLKYPYNKPPDTLPLKPTLALDGRGFENGEISLAYRIEGGRTVMHRGLLNVKVEDGWFEKEIQLPQCFPKAESVEWEMSVAGPAIVKGHAPLTWSRFRGRVEYRQGPWHSSYIYLIPVGWGSPGELYIPVGDDGTFDALVPARIYSALCANGTGYVYDSAERWAWDYDLTRDREEVFHVGRLELYGIRAFPIHGGPPTLWILFRPSSISRAHKFDANGDGVLNEEEMKSLQRGLRASPTALGPELKAENVKVWLDGQPQRILQFNQIPEAEGDGSWQVQYLVQIPADPRPKRGARHEVKLEVESQEELHGQNMVEFGEGTAGFYLP